MSKSRGKLSRAFAAAMALWLGMLMTEPLPLDACPMHGTHSMQMAGAAHSAHHVSQRGHEHQERSASHQCACIGDCSASVATALAGNGDLRVRVRIRFENLLLGGSHSREAQGVREHVQPFANGPPERSIV